MLPTFRAVVRCRAPPDAGFEIPGVLREISHRPCIAKPDGQLIIANYGRVLHLRQS